MRELRAARRGRGPAPLLAALGLVAALCLQSCSGSTDEGEDLLKGVDDATTSALCGQLTSVRVSLETARNTLNGPAIAQSAAAYESLAERARDAKAPRFASVVSKAGQAVSVLAKAAGPPATGEMADLMAKVLRVQMYETQAQLACAERGFIQ